MPRQTLPALPDPDGYLRQHLANEMHWLLRAANEWRVQERLNLEIGGYHVQVYAMDSAFLHARTLFEFLTSKTGQNHYGPDQYGISRLSSYHYSNGWKEALHEYVMHAQPRNSPQKLKGLDGSMKDLNAMPPDFATEIEKLWTEFASQLRKSGSVHRAKLVEEVLDEARHDAKAVLTNVMATGGIPRSRG